MINPNLYSGGSLAFIGDAYYELYIRKYLLEKGLTNLNDLHDATVKYVNRVSQHKAIEYIYDELSDLEKDIYKRGRNFHYKNKTCDYICASGFEALLGYLYLKGEEQRLAYLMIKIIGFVEATNA